MKSPRRACEKFQHNAAALMTFVEGTRFTPAKLPPRKINPTLTLFQPKLAVVGLC